jgi:hypothetical protein
MMDLGEFDQITWEKARQLAVKELADLPVTVCIGRMGFRGNDPEVYLDVPVKGNKRLLEELTRREWRTRHGQNVNGRRIIELSKIYNRAKVE